jgi:hypothetical protein
VSESAERDALVEQARKHFEKCKEMHRRVDENLGEWRGMEFEARQVLEDARSAYIDALYEGEGF